LSGAKGDSGQAVRFEKQIKNQKAKINKKKKP
jgi:hypothetical protein